MKNLFLFIFIALISLRSFAYISPKDKSGKPNPKPKGASCSPATAKLYMQFNDVKALIEQGGSMFQNRAATVGEIDLKLKKSINSTLNLKLFTYLNYLSFEDMDPEYVLARSLKQMQNNNKL